MTPQTFKDTRLQLGLTQKAMGEKLGGYTLRAVQLWEYGQRKIPPAVAVLVAQFTENHPNQAL